MGPTILSILMLAGIALSIGGLHLVLRRRQHRQGLLMLAAGIVMFGNVLIWVM